MVATEMVNEQGAPVIRASGLAKAFKDQLALEDAGLEVGQGEIYGLIGPDGAGKSTLMRILAGVLTYDAGELQIFDTRVHSERSAERIKPRLGFMPQGLGQNLYPELSVQENVNFFGRLRLVPAAELEERRRKLLEMTSLERYADRPMKHLSGGMKQKLGLACTLVNEPDLLLLDEPTTGVDPVSRRDFWAILASLLEERGITAVISTAYMDEAERFQRLAMFHQGRILSRGTPQEITATVSGTLVRVRPTDQMQALETARQRFDQVDARGAELRIFLRDTEQKQAKKQVRQGLGGDVEDMTTEEPELEDVFIAMLRKGDDTEEPGSEKQGHAEPDSAHLQDESGSSKHQESEENKEVVRAEGLVRDFDGFRAVDHVDFSIRAGEIFGLLGANGAGKTTVIKMLVGILPPSGGSGEVVGRNVADAPRRLKRHIGYMSQVFSLYGDLTVLENMRLYAGIYGLGGKETRERVDELLDTAGLRGRESSLAGSMPVGMRQRLALSCALLHRPRVLFLDEPTSGVDPVGRRRFWDILFRLARRDKVGLCITTHYMNEAEHCDRLAMMHEGKVVVDASPAELKQELEQDAGVLLEVNANSPMDALKALRRKYPGAALYGNAIHLLSPEPDKARERIQELLDESGVELVGVESKPLGMEDVFVNRIQGLDAQNRGDGA